MDNYSYYDFRIRKITETVNEELAFYESCNYVSLPFIAQYITYLKSRIGINQEPVVKKYFYHNYISNIQPVKKLDMNEHGKDMDILVFKKPWNKLHNIHKYLKIKEYVDNLIFLPTTNKEDIESNRKYIQESILTGLREKKFKKGKDEITYNEQEMKISDINVISFNDKTGLYEIEWYSKN